MSYSSPTIAGYFIAKSNKEEHSLSVLQVIKLVYIAHGWNLALHGKPLISDRIEAWKYGPVMPALHGLFKGLHLEKDDLVGSAWSCEEVRYIQDIHQELLNKVYAKYRKMSGEELTELLHQSDTPWHKIWNSQEGREKKDCPIADEDTKAYYSSQIDKTTFDSLSEISSIETKEEARRFLIRTGILDQNGELNPLYQS